MKKNGKKSKTVKQKINNDKAVFFKANWALLVVLLLAFIVILALSYIILVPYWNRKSLEKDISNIETTSLFSVDKIVCYSSAYGINNSETQAVWNVNLSQYTDIAIYLNVQTNVSNIYIDNIHFSNPDIGNLSLTYLPFEDFGKSPDNIVINSPETINLDLAMPITLRYLNNNLKENCLITDIETPLSFDGSILKRGKVTLSSLKNIIFFTLHIIDSYNQEYTYPITIPINLENAEKEKSIYNGNYTEKIHFSNAYFYVKKQ